MKNLKPKNPNLKFQAQPATPARRPSGGGQANTRNPKPEIQNGLWTVVRVGFVLLVVVIIGLVVAVANGVADPKPVGSLQWEDKWQITASRDKWEIFGEGVKIGDGLEIEVGEAEIGGAVTRNSKAEFSFEVAGGQSGGEIGAAYGIVFGYQSPRQYTAVLINGNGYVEVITAEGQELMAWQQWPNILLGYEANRIRVDAQNGAGVIRINDEVLLTVPVEAGAVGVLARGSVTGQVVRFGWAKYWSR
jgi:hypothetical protein